MTLNDRLINLMEREIGSDPTFGMLISMFRGNLMSIPEEELRENLRKYLQILADTLGDVEVCE